MTDVILWILPIAFQTLISHLLTLSEIPVAHFVLLLNEHFSDSSMSGKIYVRALCTRVWFDLPLSVL